jgi:hypothetical protein
MTRLFSLQETFKGIVLHKQNDALEVSHIPLSYQ